MASNFPGSLDTFTNPTSADALDSVSVPHATQHSDLNDAVEALQAKVGANSSAVTTSHDYKIAQLEAISHGKILQVVSTAKLDSYASSSTTFVDITDMSLSITPSATSSKILVMIMVAVGHSAIGSSDEILLLRDSTGIFVTTAGASPTGTIEWNNQSQFNQYGPIPLPIIYLDSPATTSATTYKLQGKTSTGSLFVNRSGDVNYGGVSSITLMEVSA